MHFMYRVSLNKSNVCNSCLLPTQIKTNIKYPISVTGLYQIEHKYLVSISSLDQIERESGETLAGLYKQSKVVLTFSREFGA